LTGVVPGGKVQSMRLVLACVAMLACTHSSEAARSDAPTVQPVATPAATPAAPPDKSPPPPADKPTAAPTGLIGPEKDAGSCQTDADCAYTRVPNNEGACCPSLCAPRVVSKKRSMELDAQVLQCAKAQRCPDPVCRMPPRTIVPACVSNQCVGRVMPNNPAD
jgi:hypothetical protein